MKQIKSEQLNSINMDELLSSMSKQIADKISDFNVEDVVIVGIHTGGYWVAEQLHQRLHMNHPLGSLNISFYRDDFTHVGLHPEVKPSEIHVAVEDKHIVLVDDVLYTGRTVRAALNEIFDYGRPASVIFCALVDRAEHELPICADVCAVSVKLQPGQQIKLSGPMPLALTLIDSL